MAKPVQPRCDLCHITIPFINFHFHDNAAWCPRCHAEREQARAIRDAGKRVTEAPSSLVYAVLVEPLPALMRYPRWLSARKSDGVELLTLLDDQVYCCERRTVISASVELHPLRRTSARPIRWVFPTLQEREQCSISKVINLGHAEATAEVRRIMEQLPTELALAKL